EAAAGRADSPGDRAPREGEAARAAEGVDSRGARNRLLPPRALGGCGARVPDDRGGDRSHRRLRALRARARAREAGPFRGGERPLQAGELDEAGVGALFVSHSRTELKAVVQRVARARSTPGGAIEVGLCVLL